jgi:hypothetical protein
MKITVFWDVTPYILVDIYQCFRGTFCLFYVEYERSTFLRNVGEHLPAYMAL